MPTPRTRDWCDGNTKNMPAKSAHVQIPAGWASMWSDELQIRVYRATQAQCEAEIKRGNSQA